MPITIRKTTTGGRGNEGRFIERDPGVCAAGIPSTDEPPVSECLYQYTLQHEVDALVNDAIIPPSDVQKLPPLRKPPPKDLRFTGFRTEAADLINPIQKSKFEQLVQDFKETPYASYWKKVVGQVPDSVPMLPKGMEPETVTFGKKLIYEESAYETIFPKIPLPDNTPKCAEAGMQVDRQYCSPPFDKNNIFGKRDGAPDTGMYMKCVLTENTLPYNPINTTQVLYTNRTRSQYGKVLAPYDNISKVPPGHAFGVLTKPDSLIQCLTSCTLNPDYIKLKECLAHLNGVRKNISKRFLPDFFNNFYLKLRHLDKERTGCLPRTVVYDAAMAEMLRFDASLIEPLLSMWNAFDGFNIKYKTFVQVMNYREHLPDLSKVPDMPLECNDFRTTYTDMVKPGQEADPRPMAGMPSGRYFEIDVPKSPVGGCRADIILLPCETTVKACLSPSIMSRYFVNHRDLYCKREPNVLRMIFEKAGIVFSDDIFNALWNKAKKYHSQGWVCIESFRKTVADNPELLNNKKEETVESEYEFN